MMQGWRKAVGPALDVAGLKVIQRLADTGYSYEPVRALRAFNLDFDDIRVVIVGTAPYPTSGLSTGLAFAVPNDVEFKPPALLNIMKEVEMSTSRFIDRTKSELVGWEEQGVFLLNTVLTVCPGHPIHHEGIGWEEFTALALNALAKRDKPLAVMLWGTAARKFAQAFRDGGHFVLEATHPSPQSASAGPAQFRFIGCRHFKQVNLWLRKRGESEIDWSQTW